MRACIVWGAEACGRSEQVQFHIICTRSHWSSELGQQSCQQRGQSEAVSSPLWPPPAEGRQRLPLEQWALLRRVSDVLLCNCSKPHLWSNASSYSYCYLCISRLKAGMQTPLGLRDACALFSSRMSLASPQELWKVPRLIDMLNLGSEPNSAILGFLGTTDIKQCWESGHIFNVFSSDEYSF